MCFYEGLGLGLGLGLLGHSITRINILSLPFKGVDIKLGFYEGEKVCAFHK